MDNAVKQAQPLDMAVDAIEKQKNENPLFALGLSAAGLGTRDELKNFLSHFKPAELSPGEAHYREATLQAIGEQLNASMLGQTAAVIDNVANTVITAVRSAWER